MDGTGCARVRGLARSHRDGAKFQVLSRAAVVHLVFGAEVWITWAALQPFRDTRPLLEMTTLGRVGDIFAGMVNGAAAQPIAGKPAPTPAALNSCLVYYRGMGYQEVDDSPSRSR